MEIIESSSYFSYIQHVGYVLTTAQYSFFPAQTHEIRDSTETSVVQRVVLTMLFSLILWTIHTFVCKGSDPLRDVA